MVHNILPNLWGSCGFVFLIYHFRIHRRRYGNDPCRPKRHYGQTVYLFCSLVSIRYIHPFSLLWEKQRKVLSWVHADKGFVLFPSFYYCQRPGASAESFMHSLLLILSQRLLQYLWPCIFIGN